MLVLSVSACTQYCMPLPNRFRTGRSALAGVIAAVVGIVTVVCVRYCRSHATRSNLFYIIIGC